LVARVSERAGVPEESILAEVKRTRKELPVLSDIGAACLVAYRYRAVEDFWKCGEEYRG
jgi:hypothetical protein